MRKIIFFMLCVISCLHLNAQKYEVTMDCPDSVKADDGFHAFFVEYHFKSDENLSNISLIDPNVENGVMSDPQKFVTHSHSMVNGEMKREYSIDIGYGIMPSVGSNSVVVEPTEYEILLNGEVVTRGRTERKEVKILANGETMTKEAELPHKIEEDDIFIQWECSRDRISLGDTIQCLCRLYYSSPHIRSIQDLENMMPDDCIIFYDSMSVNEQQKVLMDGKNYDCYTVSRCILKPMRTGEISIGGNPITLGLSYPMKLGLSYPMKKRQPMFFTPVRNVDSVFVTKKAVVMVEGNTKPEKAYSAKGEGETYLLCDVSGSMRILDFAPDRAEALMQFAELWLKEAKDCGYVTFSSVIERFCEPKQVKGKVDTTKGVTHYGTAIGDALLAPLAQGRKVKDLIVLTDGSNNTGHFSLHTAMELLRNHHIRVSYVYLNSGNPKIDYPFADSTRSVGNDCLKEPEIEAIRQDVASTGGIFLQAKSTDELIQVVYPQLKALVASKRRAPQTKPSVLDNKMVKEGLSLLKRR